MSAPDRRAMVERPGKDLSVRRQCVLLSLTRSGVYRSKPVAGADDLAVMRRIDELHLELPFYGSRRMTFELNKEGRGVNRKRVRRLMRVMGKPGAGRAAGLFGADRGETKAAPSVDLKALHAKIGELTLENDFLEGALIKAGLLSARR